MKKLLSVVVAIFLFAMFIAPADASATEKQQFCNAYADKAVAQYNLGKQYNLPGIVPPAWSDNRAGHYNWCMVVPEDIARNEQNKRQAKIREYQGAAQQNQTSKQPPVEGIILEGSLDSFDVGVLIGTAQRICENYAKVSVQQNKQNLSLNCGFNPPSWSSDYNAHKNWCLHGNNYMQAGKQLSTRKKQLVTCNGNDLIWIPGMVLGLRNLCNNSEDTFVPATKYFAARGIKFIEKTLSDEIMSADQLPSIVTYLTVDKGRHDAAIGYSLPPGIVIGLGYSVKYHRGSAGQEDAPVFGVSASNKGPEYLPGGTFKKYCGGDLGAAAGEGWCWYESTGISFNNWSEVNKLPRGTVIGLKHNRNQPNKKLIWQKVVLDPADPNISPPPGFARKVGGDRGAPSGVGYFWYEKITGE